MVLRQWNHREKRILYLHLYRSAQFQLERLERVQNFLRLRTNVYFQLCQPHTNSIRNLPVIITSGRKFWRTAASHVVPLLTTEWSLCSVHRSRSPRLFSGWENPQIAASSREISTPSNSWFLGLIWVASLNGISIGLAVFLHSTSVCTKHRHTDAQITLVIISVAIGRICCTHDGSLSLSLSSVACPLMECCRVNDASPECTVTGFYSRLSGSQC